MSTQQEKKTETIPGLGTSSDNGAAVPLVCLRHPLPTSYLVTALPPPLFSHLPRRPIRSPQPRDQAAQATNKPAEQGKSKHCRSVYQKPPPIPPPLASRQVRWPSVQEQDPAASKDGVRSYTALLRHQRSISIGSRRDRSAYGQRNTTHNAQSNRAPRLRMLTQGGGEQRQTALSRRYPPRLRVVALGPGAGRRGHRGMPSQGCGATRYGRKVGIVSTTNLAQSHSTEHKCTGAEGAAAYCLQRLHTHRAGMSKVLA